MFEHRPELQVAPGFDSVTSHEAIRYHRGASVIFYVTPSSEFPDGSLMFFLRDNNIYIPNPGVLCLIGGGVKFDERPLDAAVREVREEIFRADNNQPLTLEAARLRYLETLYDNRPGRIDIFESVLSDPPPLYTVEGRGLVQLSPEDAMATALPYNFNSAVDRYITQELHLFE